MQKFLIFVAAALASCGSSAPHAPDKIADLMPYFWKSWDAAPQAQMAEAVVNLGYATTEVTAGHPMKAELDSMTADGIAGLGLSDRDPGKTAGLLIVNVFKCTLPQVEKILIDLDQIRMYPSQYDSYSRAYTDSHDNYLARKQETLHWVADITSTHLYTMSEELLGGMRFVPDQGNGKSPFGPALIGRTLMPSPALFGDPSNEWNQDYQVEVYFEREPNRIVHAYATWREVHLPLNFESGKPFYTSQSLDNMVSWDQMTEDACSAGKP